MRKLFFFLFLAAFTGSVAARSFAQQWTSVSTPVLGWLADPVSGVGSGGSAPNLPSYTPLPRMAPDLALATYEQRLARQPMLLSAYSATQVIAADLPDTRQKGEWELERTYTAPKSLAFKSLKFMGDGFVKTNVIARLLKSEVDHVQKDDPAATALSERNYKFKYKGVDELDGHAVHVFEIKPRHKRPGLIKGRLYIDAQTGALRRVAGQLAKSPSFFVKKLEFVQDYAEVNGFTFPVHTRSSAKTRIVGRAVVDITLRDYVPVPSTTATTSTPAVQPVSLTYPGTN